MNEYHIYEVPEKLKLVSILPRFVKTSEEGICGGLAIHGWLQMTCKIFSSVNDFAMKVAWETCWNKAQ